MFKPTPPPFRNYKKKVFSVAAETGKFIYQIGEFEELRKPSQEVKVTEIKTPEFQEKIKYIKSCLKKYRKLTGKGRGITAVQIGIPQRFSVIFMPDKKGKMMIIINPVITKRSKKLLRYPEVCMSANPIIAPVARPSWIEFEYFDELGTKQVWNTKDTTKEGKMYNRVFQHEIDHMDGIIDIDLVVSRDLILESDPSFYKKAKFIEV